MVLINADRRITSQKAMQMARRSMHACYLCGENLPPRNTLEFKTMVMGEHVVAREALNASPSRPQDRWAIELDVHKCCEGERKEQSDHLLKLARDLHSKPPEEWPSSHVRKCAIKPSALVLPMAGSFVPMLSGFEKLSAGMWTWIRGLHAALYNRAISPATNWSVFPPVPTLTERARSDLAMRERTAAWLLRVVRKAVAAERWDGIIAWGGAVDYRCVWYHEQLNDQRDRWVCCWGLIIPGVLDWSRTVLGNNYRPWLGYYTVSEPPRGLVRGKTEAA